MWIPIHSSSIIYANSEAISSFTVAQNSNDSLWYVSTQGLTFYGTGYATQAEAETALTNLVNALGTITP